LRTSLEEYFRELNTISKGQLNFEISQNPNNALWIEIGIQDQNLRMPYADYEVVKHVKYL
jgi:hypothetical protein